MNTRQSLTTGFLRPASLVGFDPFFALLERHLDEKPQTYPPHDLVKYGDDKYRLTFAVAGFSESEIDITVDNNKLSIHGEKHMMDPPEGEMTIMHKGIAARDFNSVFKLGPHMKVMGAEMDGGLLHITLERVVPEELKPRKIEIISPKMIEVKDS